MRLSLASRKYPPKRTCVKIKSVEISKSISKRLFFSLIISKNKINNKITHKIENIRRITRGEETDVLAFEINPAIKILIE